MEKEFKTWIHRLGKVFIVTFFMITGCTLFLTIYITVAGQKEQQTEELFSKEWASKMLTNVALCHASSSGHPFETNMEKKLNTIILNRINQIDVSDNCMLSEFENSVMSFCTEACRCAKKSNSNKIDEHIFIMASDSVKLLNPLNNIFNNGGKIYQ